MKTFKGNSVHLLGDPKKVGDLAVDFKAVNNSLQTVNLSDFKSKYIILNVVPSLDTVVCDLQTKTVDQEFSQFKSVTILTLSVDLPFAQARWCGLSNVNSITLSDYLYHDFGMKYGLLIEENKLLSRCIMVLDEKRKIIYYQTVDEQSQHLNYDDLLKFMETVPNE